jgi:molybdopterin converting factor small subunit
MKEEKVQITIKCFSVVKYILGESKIVLEVPLGTTTSDVEALLRERAQGKLDDVPFRTAVNRAYCAHPVELHDGDEVAFIPPVQGG